MLPIYAMFDTGLDQVEKRAILEGLAEFLNTLPERKVISFGSTEFAEGDYSSADWYIRNCKKRVHYGRIQLDADSLIDMMMQEPWQADPHIDILFVSNDLFLKNGSEDFVFGLSCSRVSVQSVFRYRRLSSNDRFLAIKYTLHHELGHILGACSDPDRDLVEDNHGLHCKTIGCTMRQGLTALEYVRNAKQSDIRHTVYCPHCLQEIKKSLI